MLRGPGYFNMDAGLSRTFTFKETKRVELRAEATNILNHTNFYGPGDAGTIKCTADECTADRLCHLDQYEFRADTSRP